MMARPHVIERSNAGAVGDYLTESLRSAYYVKKDGKESGISFYIGGGAKALGIAGSAVTLKAFERLLEGLDPKTGEKLTQNAGSKSRNKLGFDCVMTPPKSVDLLMAFAAEPLRVKIIAAITASNAVAMEYLAANLEIATGKGGQHREKCDGVTIAGFGHFTARPGPRGTDMSKHIHNVIFAAARREDGTWGSIDERDIRTLQKETGSIFASDLASRLAAMGFGIEESPRNGWAFKVAGISEEAELEFSQRHAEIMAHADAKGLDMSKPSDDNKAWANTRKTKEETEMEGLQAEWAIRGAPFGLNANAIEALRKAPKQNALAALNVQELADALTENKSTFERKDLLCAVAQKAARNGGLSRDECIRITDEFLKDAAIFDLGLHELKSDKINALRHARKVPQAPKRRKLYTTAAALVEEIKLAKLYEAATQDHRHDRSEQATGAAMARYEASMSAKFGKPVKIKDEQRKMAEALAKCGRVGLVQGSAGTGKSFAAGAVRDLEEASGQTVHGVSLAAVAAEGLKSGAGIGKGGTLHSLLFSIKSGKTKLSERDTIIVDEAAMVGSAQILELLQASDATGAKLIFIGDKAQFGAIARGGGWFASMQETHAHSTLSDIERQKIGWHLAAVHDMKEGRGIEGLAAFADKDCFKAFENSGAALRALAHSYINDENPMDKKIAMASTHKQAKIVNDEARRLLIERGELGKVAHFMQFENSKGTEAFAVEIRTGERLKFTKNKKLKSGEQVRNGETCTVSHVGKAPSGETFLTVQHANGTELKIGLRDYANLSYAYCSTAVGAQGATVAKAFAYIDERACQQNGYVAASRSTAETVLFASKTFDGKGKDTTLKTLGRALSVDKSADYSLDYLDDDQRKIIEQALNKPDAMAEALAEAKRSKSESQPPAIPPLPDALPTPKADPVSETSPAEIVKKETEQRPPALPPETPKKPHESICYGTPKPCPPAETVAAKPEEIAKEAATEAPALPSMASRLAERRQREAQPSSVQPTRGPRA
ncbi:MobF family relaxase [Janthinobacterium sp. PSRC1-1]|uniref:MobF family relaxase n=1 Tax=Janthinobacterium sp. PSRC1-1 TaxID=2804586 RepID=UPI003CED06FC